jgi:hypothetical protein
MKLCTFKPLIATAALAAAALCAGSVLATELEFVQSPPMSYSVTGNERGAAGELKPQWLNATGVVGGSQYRLVAFANSAYLDMVVTQSSGARCAIKRYRSISAEGVPPPAAQGSLALPIGAQSLMMRLAQSADTGYVYLYNEAATGSCTVWLQAS